MDGDLQIQSIKHHGNVTYTGTEFADGLGKDETKSTYITFNVKKEAITDLLNHPNGIVEDFPTTASAIVKHEYTRYDYSWKKSNDKEDAEISRTTWGFWAIDQKDANGEEVKDKNGTYLQEGKMHYTVPDNNSDSAPYLALQVNNGENSMERTISGTIFKDNNIRSSTKEVVGDGEYNNDENVVSGVKVELLEKSTMKMKQ